MTSPPLRIVVTDANVLINLLHVERLDLCTGLPGLEFVVPEHVREEIKAPDHRKALDSALGSGLFRVVLITEPEDIALFADLTAHLGRGEVACLVLPAWSRSRRRTRTRRGSMRNASNCRLDRSARRFSKATGSGADNQILPKHRHVARHVADVG